LASWAKGVETKDVDVYADKGALCAEATQLFGRWKRKGLVT
jgi:hypothetical protein